MQLAPEKYVAVVHNHNMQTAAPTAIVKQIVIFFHYTILHLWQIANHKINVDNRKLWIALENSN